MNIEMKNIGYLLTILTIILTSNIFAQLELSTYTDKSEYQYGEKIQLYCKVTNTADTTFQFFAGTYQSCQAEFSFNDFKSVEHTACLATTELLTFEPHSSKIYSWTIDPVKYGLPNNDRIQMIIGTYYFGLTDTTYITAPQFLGGQVSVGFLKENTDTLQKIKDSLNITVLDHSEFENSVSELWQIEGYQIDSLISDLQENNNLTYIENAVFVEYDNIIDEDPLEYYPIHVGDYWVYEVKYFKYSFDEPDTTYYATTSVTGIDTLNGQTYFIIDNVFNERQYIRIDSTNATVWEYREGDEDFLLTELACSKGDIWGEYFECIKDTILNIFESERRAKYIRNNIVFTSGDVIRDYIYAFGIGQISLDREEVNVVASVRKANLVYANIDGQEYGDIDTSQQTNFFPLQIGNRWQYSEDLGEVLESKAIGDTTMSNSLTYIKVQGVFFRGYFRKENSRIYSYDTLLNEEELIYDFSLKVGDTLSVKVIDQDTIVTTVSSEGIAPIFGEDRKYMTFFSDEINSSGDFERKVIDAIGFVQFYGEVFSYGLTGAVIDSVSYGNIVNVENPNESIPNKYSLSQNYPNPFNPSTTIKYSIPFVERKSSFAQTTDGLSKSQSGDWLYNVTLKVYDILGREIAALVNKVQKPGNYEVTFDASNLSSGVYFYQLKTGSFIKTNKMILLR